MNEYKEFVVKLKSGKYEWVDPIDEVVVHPDNASTLIVRASTGYEYTYKLEDIDQWIEREYEPHYIFPFGEHDKERQGHYRALLRNK